MFALFQPSFWFTTNPPMLVGWIGTAVFVFFLLCFVFGMVSRILLDRTEDRYVKLAGRHITRAFTTMGILGLILFFFSFERIPFLGARLWYPLWLIASVLWGLWIVRFVKKRIPTLREKEKAQQMNNRYFPSRRK